MDVDLTGTVAEVPGYPTTNRVWYRAAASPLAVDVQRMTADVATAFREWWGPIESQLAEAAATCASVLLLLSPCQHQIRLLLRLPFLSLRGLLLAATVLAMTS